MYWSIYVCWYVWASRNLYLLPHLSWEISQTSQMRSLVRYVVRDIIALSEISPRVLSRNYYCLKERSCKVYCLKQDFSSFRDHLHQARSLKRDIALNEVSDESILKREYFQEIIIALNQRSINRVFSIWMYGLIYVEISRCLIMFIICLYISYCIHVEYICVNWCTDWFIII